VTSAANDPMLGRLIDGRYQVKSRIARGGMATVYLATDLRLERRVAVKIMHGHLADDTAFKARFVQEALSAARLSHPNVVNVYDQGQDTDMAYLVMEYLPGITLRDLLKDYGKLTPEQTCDIMDAVLRGLAAAHESGILHRDLKPENVLLADDGRIKLGDFGLARATTANTASGQALLGTIAYLSPELLTRGEAGVRSDLYSVGIMMFEMLTGEQPYKGDQPMQVAYQHANDTVPAPSSVNPNVPAELDAIVAWATAKNPEDRPANASQMLERLLQAEDGIRGGTGSYADVSTQATMIMPRGMVAGSDDETRVITGALAGLNKKSALSDPVGALKEVTDVRRARGRWILAIVLALGLIGGGLGWWFSAGPGSLVSVPSVSGLTPEKASVVISGAGFETELVDKYDVAVPKGQVIGTDPDAGVPTAKGARVKILVSLGAKVIDTPNVAGQPEATAKKTLTEANLVVVEPSLQYFSDTVAAGMVIQLLGPDGKPVGAKINEGTKVTMAVSVGAVPKVSGMSEADATKALGAVKLNVGTVKQEFSDTIPAGQAISITPPEGNFGPGANVTLNMSKGPDLVAVPNVANQNLDFNEAIAKIKAAGLNYTTDVDSALFAKRVVKTQTPAAGTMVKRGSNVFISY